MKTLVGVFDSRNEAENVKDSLIAVGIDANDISIQSAEGGMSAVRPTEAESSSGGGLSGFFRRLFGAEESSDELSGVYSEAVRRGSGVVCVDAESDEEAQRIETIMQQAGAIDIDERSASWRAAGWSGYRAEAPALSPAELEAERQRIAAEKQTIPVVEEELAVGKRQVERGRVRVFTRVHERPVEETVSLREERATVERRPVDRPATEADIAAAMKGESVEIRETAEQAVVGKRAKVVEEVEIGKEATEKTETIRDTVRETEVDIEQSEQSAEADVDLEKEAARTGRRRGPSGQQPRM